MNAIASSTQIGWPVRAVFVFDIDMTFPRDKNFARKQSSHRRRSVNKKCNIINDL
jgi:hypothetical protein